MVYYTIDNLVRDSLIEDNLSDLERPRIRAQIYQQNKKLIYMAEKKTYTVRIESPFVLTQKYIKEKLGIGFKVSSVEMENDAITPQIIDIDSAVEAIVKTGYRALARAYHPDLGGSVETMQILNRSKKELLDLLESIK